MVGCGRYNYRTLRRRKSKNLEEFCYQIASTVSNFSFHFKETQVEIADDELWMAYMKKATQQWSHIQQKDIGSVIKY